jgi:dTDP-4-dehydrorhamnose reductase
MKILLLGRDGQLGHALAVPLTALGQVTAMGRAEADFADTDALSAMVRYLQPEVIVNAAAYTAVDKAESEPENAMRVNTVSVGALGEEAARIGARVVHYSTDYVFDGTKPSPYVETDATGPLNTYGESKLAGENALLGSGAHAIVLRTSWVYAARGRNFVHTMLRLGRERARLGTDLRVVGDQIGAPTSAEDLAAATVVLLRNWTVQRGVYHATAQGEVSWAGFAREIFDLAALPVHIVPITTQEYPTPAARPRNSRLDCSKLLKDFGIALHPWQDGLRRVMAEIGS